MIREELVAQARTWIGTPFHHQGRQKRIGVDCVGLLVGLAGEFREQGYDREEYRRYKRRPPRGRGMLEHLDRDLGRSSRSFTAGDILVFWIEPQTRRAQHLALATSREAMVHAYADGCRVREDTIDDWWRERFIAAYRFPGVED